MEPNFQNDTMTKPSKLETPGDALSVRTHKIAVIGLFAALALVLAGIYLWITAEKQTPVTPTPTRPTYETNREPESTNAQAEVGTLQVLSTSNELSAIEADLLSTDLSNLEKELTQIEQELQ